MYLTSGPSKPSRTSPVSSPASPKGESQPAHRITSQLQLGSTTSHQVTKRPTCYQPNLLLFADNYSSAQQLFLSPAGNTPSVRPNNITNYIPTAPAPSFDAPSSGVGSGAASRTRSGSYTDHEIGEELVASLEMIDQRTRGDKQLTNTADTSAAASDVAHHRVPTDALTSGSTSRDSAAQTGQPRKHGLVDRNTNTKRKHISCTSGQPKAQRRKVASGITSAVTTELTVRCRRLAKSNKNNMQFCAILYKVIKKHDCVNACVDTMLQAKPRCFGQSHVVYRQTIKAALNTHGFPEVGWPSPMFERVIVELHAVIEKNDPRTSSPPYNPENLAIRIKGNYKYAGVDVF